MSRRLRSVQTNQLQGSSTMLWPEWGGYLDFVTDDRNNLYLRFYVGQSTRLLLRLDTHCRSLLAGDIHTLHYFILNLGNGHRSSNWLQLWTIPEELYDKPQSRSGFSVSLIQCFLEKLFCHAFQSLPDVTLAEYFGTAPSGHYAGTGLNILSPLLQPMDLSTVTGVRQLHRSRLLSSPDPEIQSWPDIRRRALARDQAAKPTSKPIPPSITAYRRLTQEQLVAEGVPDCSFDTLLSKSRLPSDSTSTWATSSEKPLVSWSMMTLTFIRSAH